jgi:hypothetical protein
VAPKVTDADEKYPAIIAPPSLVAAIDIVDIDIVPVPVFAEAQDHAPALVIFATKAVFVPAKDKVVDPSVIEEVWKYPVTIAPPSLVPAIFGVIVKVPVPVLVEAHDHAPALDTLVTNIVLVPARESVVDPKVTEELWKKLVIIAPLSLVATNVGVVPTVPEPVFELAQEKAPALDTLVTNKVFVPANDSVVGPNVTEADEKVPRTIAPPSLVAETLGFVPRLPVPVLANAHDHTPALVIFAINIVLLPASDKILDPNIIGPPLKVPTTTAPPSVVPAIENTVPMLFTFPVVTVVLVEAQDQDPVLDILEEYSVKIPAKARAVDPKVIEEV